MHIAFLLSLFKTSPFLLLPFFFLILFSLPLNLPRKTPCPVFCDSKDYHPDIFPLIIAFVQQPGKETQSARQKQEARVFGNHSHLSSLHSTGDAFWLRYHGVPGGMAQHGCILSASLWEAQPKLLVLCRSGRRWQGEITFSCLVSSH